MEIDTAIHILSLPYTYTITTHGNKAAARQQLGGMAAEILEVMRDELLHESILNYLMNRGYTLSKAEAILNDTRKDGAEGAGARTQEFTATEAQPNPMFLNSESP